MMRRLAEFGLSSDEESIDISDDEESIDISVEHDEDDMEAERYLDMARRQNDSFKSVFHKVMPEVLAAFLSGKSWERSMQDFFQLNASTFAEFRRGEEHDHIMWEVHKTYLDTVDEILKKRADEFELPFELDEAFFSAAGVGDELQKQVEQLHDFEDFGEMMRAKNEISGHLRVLWDIQNVKAEDPQAAVEALRAFFLERRRRCLGDKVDVVINAFVPQSMASEQYGKALDRANVVVQLCTNKKEDADQKLKDCVVRDMRVLSPSCTTFVVISSDTGFSNTMQNMRSEGFHVTSVHEYQNHCSAKRSLEQHCNDAFTFSQILSGQRIREGLPRSRSQKNPYSKSGVPVGVHLIGKVSQWIGNRGYGFIKAKFEDGSLTFFCHATSLPPCPERFLEMGEIVLFGWVPPEPPFTRPKALHVQAASGQLACV